MSAVTAIWVTIVAFVIFLAIDLTWLGIVAQGVYKHHMGGIMLDKPRWGAAFLFYGIFVIGLVYFAIAPAIADHSLQTAVVKGALFGFFTYATFDLTSYAVLKGFPGAIVPIDMAWGTVLAMSVSAATYGVYNAITG